MQLWLLWNAAVKSLVIAFRGTEQVKWKDLMTDLSFQPAPFNPERVLEREQQRIPHPAGGAAPVRKMHYPATPPCDLDRTLARAVLIALQTINTGLQCQRHTSGTGF